MYSSKCNSLIDSSPHMSLSVRLSNVGHLNCHSLSHRHFQHMTARCCSTHTQTDKSVKWPVIPTEPTLKMLTLGQQYISTAAKAPVSTQVLLALSWYEVILQGRSCTTRGLVLPLLTAFNGLVPWKYPVHLCYWREKHWTDHRVIILWCGKKSVECCVPWQIRYWNKWIHQLVNWIYCTISYLVQSHWSERQGVKCKTY